MKRSLFFSLIIILTVLVSSCKTTQSTSSDYNPGKKPYQTVKKRNK